MRDKFFSKKREWSRYKDFILNYYLEPYIAKVSTLGKPVLIVDCFAGCGSFGDGEDGSPLIICKAIQKAGEKAVPIKAEFIEERRDNYDCLVECLKPYKDFATPYLGTFEDNLPALAQKARNHTVFLYVDPYTVKALLFKRMKDVYDMIKKASASVEVLINFNAATFMRWALSILKPARKDDDLRYSEEEGADYQADDPSEAVELPILDEIAGGGYWKSIALDADKSFPEKLEDFTHCYLRKLNDSFPFAASCEIKSKYEHQVPKYSLVFGTRHPDGVELMNDAMCNARLEFLGNQFSKGLLFDCTPECEIPDEDKLRADILALVAKEGSLTRKAIRQKLICGPYFGRVVSKSLNRVVGDLLKAQKLASSTGKTRINDDVRLACVAR